MFNADEITLQNIDSFPNWENTQFVRCQKKSIKIQALQMNFPEGFEVTTPSGKVKAEQGDYLMFGVLGEKYPCVKEVFEKSYDIIKD